MTAYYTTEGEFIFKGTEHEMAAELLRLRRHTDHLEGELDRVAAQRDELLNRLQWSNVGTGQAFLLKGVGYYDLASLLVRVSNEADAARAKKKAMVEKGT